MTRHNSLCRHFIYGPRGHFQCNHLTLDASFAAKNGSFLSRTPELKYNLSGFHCKPTWHLVPSSMVTNSSLGLPPLLYSVGAHFPLLRDIKRAKENFPEELARD